MPRIVREPKSLEPYWATSDKETVKLYLGDVIDVLRGLPSRSVQMVVTSPPYWGLRNYNAGVKEIGSERTPEEFVLKMVEVFGEIKRVLRNDGTVWLNLGDSYGGGNGGLGESSVFRDGRKKDLDGVYDGTVSSKSNLPSGNLTGIPWRVALALQADGWILRQDIIWAKPSPMPESVTNRCTKAHEYLFLLTQSDRYFYDAEAIKEDSNWNDAKPCKGKTVQPTGNRNKRSVWTVSSQGYEGAHFAVFPPKLIEPTILAGTSEYGCCIQCGKGWTRVVDKTKLTRDRPNDYVKRKGEEGTGNSCSNSVAGVQAITTGWKQQCGCDTTEVRPCTVLDPFIGSGTTSAVCIELGRHSVGIDLSEVYLKNNAIPRIEGALLARPGRAHLTGREAKEVRVGRRVGVRRG